MRPIIEGGPRSKLNRIEVGKKENDTRKKSVVVKNPIIEIGTRLKLEEGTKKREIPVCQLPDLANLRLLDNYFKEFQTEDPSLKIPENENKRRLDMAHTTMRDHTLLIDGDYWDILSVELYGREDIYTIDQPDHRMTNRGSIFKLTHIEYNEPIPAIGIWLGRQHYTSYFIITSIGQRKDRRVDAKNKIDAHLKMSAEQMDNKLIQVGKSMVKEYEDSNYCMIYEGTSTIADLFILTEESEMSLVACEDTEDRTAFENCYSCPRVGLTLKHEVNKTNGFYVQSIMRPRRYSCTPSELNEEMHMFVIQAAMDGIPTNKIPKIMGVHPMIANKWQQLGVTTLQLPVTTTVSHSSHNWRDINFQIAVFNTYAHIIWPET